jgi:SulP family sulfate permease
MTFAFYKKLKTYGMHDYRKDLLAGLTVAVMVIPQGMAYALLAGLPPIYGLYAALVPMLIYPFFGSSLHLSVGPVALVSILVLSGLSTIAEPMSEEYIQLAILTSLVAGAIQVILSVVRMGFLVNFLSQPVISGFTSAAAFIIALSQLKHLLGIPMERTSNVVTILEELFYRIQEINPYTLLIGLVALLLILWIRKIKESIPAALFAVFLGIGVVYFFQLQDYGVAIVEDVPEGLPHFSFPSITLSNVLKVFPLAFVICLISFIESLAIAKTLSAKNNNYPISANQELLGLGIAKVIGGFFQAFPNTGSFTRSAINEQAGAKTGISSLWTAFFVGLTLVFFTGLFYYLPQTVLASIIIASVIGLVDYKEAIFLYGKDKKDFSVMILTFLVTLFIGIQEGVLAGVILSLIFILYKTSRPHFAELGKLPDSSIYKNVTRFDEAETTDSYLIVRYDADIFFANAEHFYETVLSEARNKKDLRCVILDASAIGSIDSTGVKQLKLLREALEKANIEFLITGLKGPMRDIFTKYELYDLFPKNKQFLNIDVAVSSLENKKAQSLPNPDKLKAKGKNIEP